MTAAIIGGGIAGLTAAFELVKAGERPILIEADSLGGMVRSVESQGFTLECGPNVLVERPELKDLLSELKLSSEVVYPSVARYGQYVWFRGKAEKVPAGLFEFITSALFSPLSKLLLPYKAIVPGVLKSGSVGDSEDLSVAQFFSPLIGSAGVQNVIDPVLKGIYGGDVATLSARAIFPKIWAAAQEGLSLLGYLRSRSSKGKPPILVIKGGVQRITNALWHEVAPHVEQVKAQAQRILKLEGGRFRVILTGGREIESDGCLVSVAGHRLAPLLGALDPELSEALSALRYASLNVVHLAVKSSERLIPDAFGVLFPGGMPEDLLGVMFNSLIFPHTSPRGEHLLTVVLGGAQAGERVFSEDELRLKLPRLLSELLGIGESRWLSMTQWPRAIPQLEVGHYKLIQGLDRCEERYPGIVFAGVDRGGVGVSDRIRIAKEAVRRFRRMRIETVV